MPLNGRFQQSSVENGVFLGGAFHAFPRGPRRKLSGFTSTDPIWMQELADVEAHYAAQIMRDGCLVMGFEYDSPWSNEPIPHFTERARLSSRRYARSLKELEAEEWPIHIPMKIKAPPPPMFDECAPAPRPAKPKAAKAKRFERNFSLHYAINDLDIRTNWWFKDWVECLRPGNQIDALIGMGWEQNKTILRLIIYAALNGEVAAAINGGLGRSIGTDLGAPEDKRIELIQRVIDIANIRPGQLR